jgi:catechol 2,3-dioxygenase-like lactoylglutathione lyase family enzyme
VKHTVCHIEFSSADLDRSTAFYSGLFSWTVIRATPDELLFRSPDGLQGTIRRVDTVTPSKLPLLRIEVDDYAPIIDLAARFQGGYSGFVDPLQGDWAINLRDPDGNLIRLSREAPAPPVPEPDSVTVQEQEPRRESGSEALSVSLSPAAVVQDMRKVTARVNGNSSANGNGAGPKTSRARQDISPSE